MGQTGYSVGGPFRVSGIEALNRPITDDYLPDYDFTYLPDKIPERIPEDSPENTPNNDELIALLRSNNGDGADLGFDPSRAATNLSNAEIAAGYAPTVEGRVTDSLTQSVIDTLKGNAAKMATVGGMGGVVNPGDLLNPQNLLTAAPKAMMAGAGIQSEGFVGSLGENVIPAIASLVGGPALGLATGIVGPVIGDVMGDLFGTREADTARDKLEDASGELRGRRQYRSIMDRFGVDDLRYAEEEGDFGSAGQRAANQTQMAQNKPFTNVDLIQNQMNKTKAYEMAQALIDNAHLNTTLTRSPRSSGGGDQSDRNKYGLGNYTPGNERNASYGNSGGSGGRTTGNAYGGDAYGGQNTGSHGL